MSTEPSLCLCMMVCNEQHVVGRALRSVKHLVDYWVVCDTGSADATPMVVLNTMSGVPGELHRTEWTNFGANRTEVLRMARKHADYLLMMDADMIAHVRVPEFKQKLTADSYDIGYEGPVDYSQVMLVSSRHDWKYVGVTHEYVHSDTAKTRERLRGLSLTHFGDGGMRMDKFERDARLLSAEYAKNPEDPRTVFYLAQSHYYLGNYSEAMRYYGERAALTGWEEERWYAMYMLGKARDAQGMAWELVIEDYKRAYEARPSRLEPLYEIVKHYRENEDYETGYAYARIAGLAAPYPDDLLFIEKPLHEFYFLLELGVCAYGCGQIAEAIDAFNLVLRRLPAESWVRESAIRGRSFALQAMPRGPVPSEAQGANHIVVVTPFRNPGEAFERCIRSLAEQDYADFEVILIDDASTDAASNFHPDDPRMRVIRRDRQMGLAANLHDVLLHACHADDVVVCVDGDDWLVGTDVLSYVDEIYRKHDCWVSFGQFEFENGDYGFSQPFSSEEDFATLREYFRTSHLRTFRAGLFERIAEQDPEYACLKKRDGEWLDSAVDVALMCPLLELAGFSRARFVDRVLYHYNGEGPNHTHNERRQSQVESFEYIRSKPRFTKVQDYLAAVWSGR